MALVNDGDALCQAVAEAPLRHNQVVARVSTVQEEAGAIRAVVHSVHQERDIVLSSSNVRLHHKMNKVMRLVCAGVRP